jgi:uncharacterized protein with ATP-grasp and redox domains
MIPDLTIDITPPEIGWQVYRIVDEITGIDDSYKEGSKRICQSVGYVLYLTDNAGEIAFARFLIEQMLHIKKLRIVVAVREKPIINDATLEDALKVGLNEVATIISNGSDAPATILSQCSPKMRGYDQAADLIIAKGQGNYESLSDRAENIFFLFKVKCPVVAGDSGYDIDSPVLISSTVSKMVKNKITLLNESQLRGIT